MRVSVTAGAERTVVCSVVVVVTGTGFSTTVVQAGSKEAVTNSVNSRIFLIINVWGRVYLVVVVVVLVVVVSSTGAAATVFRTITRDATMRSPTLV